MNSNFLTGQVRRTRHAGDDDLVTAGLGLERLAGAPVAFADPGRPTVPELRRRAIQFAWKGLADLGPLGGYGRVYGAAPAVPGHEFSAFARLPGASQPHRVLCQVPEAFDTSRRCLLVAASSGSRGMYGPVSLAGVWGLPRGCAVVYTDKGTGTGYFDCASGTGVTLDGSRARAGETTLEFEPLSAPANAGLAIKHAHSGDHPEADWGGHVLQAIQFGLAMLGEAFPAEAPFTPQNTRIIAVGISNGGGAVLQAAGMDDKGWLDGVVAIEPNVHVPGSGRAIYDYVSEAGLLLPCVHAHERFASIPFARDEQGKVPAAWAAQSEALHVAGRLESPDPAARADEALQMLLSAGWQEPTIASAAFSTAFDVWRAIGALYASAYTRSGVGQMPMGYAYRQAAVEGLSQQAVRAAWWPEGTGIPPHPGVALVRDQDGDAPWTGLLGLRALWEGNSGQAGRLHRAVEQLAVKLPRPDLPLHVVHGAEDGLVPPTFSSDPYVRWLRDNGRNPVHWRLPHVQHFDAFLMIPGFGDRYVPVMPYAYAALDRVHAQIFEGADDTRDAPAPQPRPRGADALECGDLGLTG